jgi:WXG100 family type VII secretion target
MFEGGGGGGGLMQSDTDQLTSAAIEANNTAEALDTMLRNLMDRLSPLMTEWLGAGGSRFQVVRQEFEIEMGKLDSALRSVGEDMGVTSVDYSTADEDMAADLAQAGASTEQIDVLLAGLEGR